MKITKGYTLSQFVDWIEIDNFGTGNDDVPECCIPDYQIRNIIFAYNDFLKQPPNKDQFVNPYEKPCNMLYYENALKYKMDRAAWQEAEKKVIFKGWKQNPSYANGIYNDNGEEIYFYKNGEAKYLGEKYHNKLITCYGDLFQATNGELELQNVEL